MAISHIARAPATTARLLARAQSSRNAPSAYAAIQSRYISSNKPRKAAVSPRPTPAPSFNQTPSSAKRSPQPLSSHPRTEFDDSFVGMTGGQIFHEMMLRQNVKHVFGYPGGAILPVFDAIYNSKHFDFVLPRHEQGAGHMAEGYARASGKPGVVLVTSGPGATNVITPMQDALSDGTPMVVFCGQVVTTAIGTDAFQEADIVGISRACTKWNVMVKDIEELPRRINEAFEIATTGRPGPVLVDLPKDVTAGILTRPIPTQSALPQRPTYGVLTREAEHAIHPGILKAAQMLNGAKKPIIYAGQGLLHSPGGPEALAKLAAAGNIPVTTTLQGLGAFDEMDSKSLHMLGMHGSAYANLAIQDADVILALGARFDDRVTGNLAHFAPAAHAAALEGKGGIIHFEIQPKNVNKVVQAQVAIEGDVASNLADLIPLVETSERKPWFNKISAWKEEFPFAFTASKDSDLLMPQEVIEELNKQTETIKDKVIITTGVGQHQMWAAQHYRWRHPRTFITSGGLGTMGFGLPSAIGAKVARPDMIVVDIDGDASFSMTAMELQTASQYNIGVKVLILNNEFQGMVLQWQDLFYDKRYSQTQMFNPDFCKLANSMNVHAIRCDNIKDLPKAMEEFLAYDKGPVLFETRVVNTHVLPMVPAGRALHQQLTYQEVEKQKAAAAAAKA